MEKIVRSQFGRLLRDIGANGEPFSLGTRNTIRASTDERCLMSGNTFSSSGEYSGLSRVSDGAQALRENRAGLRLYIGLGHSFHWHRNKRR